ncbi:hypothetical protein SUGI_1011890 [Cryptomeria japonica]|nr:hypothetical protein SUGI_1011890 [Cryptomeria japonica]
MATTCHKHKPKSSIFVSSLTLLQRYKFFLSFVAVLFSAYLYSTIRFELREGGKMSDIQAESHEELTPPLSLSPPASSSQVTVTENIDNTRQDSTEDLPPPSSPPPPPPPSPPHSSPPLSPSASAPAPAVAPLRYQAQETVTFNLTETCLLFLHRGDITKWFVDGQSDAIVNAANKRLLGGGGVDGAIHNAAGPDLLQACKEIPEIHPGIRCPVGSARITRGFQLPVSHIIHTVGPMYDLEEDPESKLSDAYRSSLDLAKENEVKYIAFPAISCGIYGYPYEEAAEVSLTTVRDSANDLKEVHFVLFEAPAWKAWVEEANELFEQT